MNTRIIKFRVWDIRNKNWVSVFEKSFLDNPKYIVQQFTGLKDKKGKEIYEGDVVKIDDAQGEIIFFDGAFWVSFLESGGNILLFVYNKIAEITGNILENSS